MKEQQIARAFYKGTGKEPFALQVELAAGQVCGVKNKVEIAEPAIKCAFCEATGVYPRNTLVACIFCDGKGTVAVGGAILSARIQAQQWLAALTALDAEEKGAAIRRLIHGHNSGCYEVYL